MERRASGGGEGGCGRRVMWVDGLVGVAWMNSDSSMSEETVILSPSSSV